MTSLMKLWAEMPLRSRIGLAVGAIVIFLVTAWLAVYSLRQDYQVLFSDLAPQDAAAMIAELDRTKVPYKLEDGGNTILVSKDMVHKTRLKLLAKDFPLHGAVGFELFNNADFGMTDFAQKVNYQRALQGEITRTILSIDGIQSVRVHLALPEQGLFKKDAARPKASITLSMKPGRTLGQEQVTGIQRLVSASVADITPQDVTLVDQHGIALTKTAGVDGEMDVSDWRLDLKRTTEDYFTKKVLDVLSTALGPGQGIASVDVLLNHDQVKVTTEDVLPAKRGTADPSPTGVIVRERQILRESTQKANGAAAESQKLDGQGSVGNNVEIEYQTGRRTEQIVTAPGSIHHLSVAVVVKKSLDQAQLDRIKNVVALAVGYRQERGDAIVVYSMQQFAGASPGVSESALPASPPLKEMLPEGIAVTQERIGRENKPIERWLQAALAEPNVLMLCVSVVVLLLLVGVAVQGRWRPIRTETKQLSAPEREALLANVRLWLGEKSTSGQI